MAGAGARNCKAQSGFEGGLDYNAEQWNMPEILHLRLVEGCCRFSLQKNTAVIQIQSVVYYVYIHNKNEQTISFDYVSRQKTKKIDDDRIRHPH